MLVTDILGHTAEYFHTIRNECSDFISQSGGFPVFRALPRTYSTFQKVKVRANKKHDSVSEAFDNAFNNEFHNISARSIVAQSMLVEHSVHMEPFYVFPINGFKFIYSKGVQSSNNDFRSVLDTLKENVDGAFEMTSDLIKYTYTKRNLVEGIVSDAEIIFYGVPYYYAVRVNDVDSYTKLINR